MVITRKIEVFVCENDKDQRRAYYEKLYANRDIAVKAANTAAANAHKNHCGKKEIFIFISLKSFFRLPEQFQAA